MLLSVLALIASATAETTPHSGTTDMMPHEQYPSLGVLGCKINTNRVAYWPGAVSCDDICVRITHGDFSTHVLKIDSSAGAYDIFFFAFGGPKVREIDASSQIAVGG
jgi:hypothetical protein